MVFLVAQVGVLTPRRMSATILQIDVSYTAREPHGRKALYTAEFRKSFYEYEGLLSRSRQRSLLIPLMGAVKATSFSQIEMS